MLRERLLPAVCFAATLAACALLWRRQAAVAPYAVGEVHAEIVQVNSPAAGQLLPLSESDQSEWPLLTEVQQGGVVARLQPEDGATVEVTAPISGVVTAVAAHPGEWVRAGRPVMTISSARPKYIICHRPDQRAKLPRVGQSVMIRQRGHGGQWVISEVEAVGPAYEAMPAYHGAEAVPMVRGLPIRIAMPVDVDWPPGSLVEVRFPPTEQSP
jgi:multidrug resistance efflux pump